jgi:hypothetical protein
VTYLRKHLKLVTVAATCVAIGAAGSAIATAGAASNATTTKTSSPTAGPARVRGAGARAIERRAIHAEAVVATKTGFATVTLDRGFVQSVSGRQLTIREGTKNATYRTVTLAIPSNAKVRDDRRASALSALTPGQRVAVVQGPKRTWVIARSVKTP